MSEIRNLDGKLVCRIDYASGTLEIKVKDCITLIKVNPDGTTEVVNRKNPAAQQKKLNKKIRETARRQCEIPEKGVPLPSFLSYG